MGSYNYQDVEITIRFALHLPSSEPASKPAPLARQQRLPRSTRLVEGGFPSFAAQPADVAHMQGSAACATALVFGGDWVPIFPGGTLSSLQMLPDAHIAGKSDRPVVYLDKALGRIMLLDQHFVVRRRYRGMRRLLYILAPFFLEPRGCTFGVMSPCIPNLLPFCVALKPATCYVPTHNAFVYKKDITLH